MPQHPVDPDEPLAEINITNLVDVMLVLLVLFIITAPILRGGLEVDLPRTRAARPLEAAEGINVTVDGDGAVHVDGKPVPDEDLVSRVRPKDDGDPVPVYLSGDRAVDYGRVIAVLGLLQAGGVQNVGLIAEPTPRRP